MSHHSSWSFPPKSNYYCNYTMNNHFNQKNVANIHFFVVKLQNNAKKQRSDADFTSVSDLYCISGCPWLIYIFSKRYHSSIMTVHLNIPFLAEKRHEPLYFSEVEITLWIPIPCKCSGISSKWRVRLQVFSHEITRCPDLCFIEIAIRGSSALLSIAPWKAFSKMLAMTVTRDGGGTEISGFAAARISIAMFFAVAFW